MMSQGMEQEITVRFAVLGDLAFAAQDGHVPAKVVKRKIEWQEVVIAQRGESSVGYARLEYLWSAVPYVALIYVLPKYRKQGIGKAILAFIERFLIHQGHEVLYSSSQLDEPEPQAWHRHVGFEECGIIAGINDGGIGEVFFCKPLCSARPQPLLHKGC